MAITKIVGFQQYADYLNTQFTDFLGIGDIPIRANNLYRVNKMQFKLRDDRVWLFSEGWYSTSNDYARQGSISIPFSSVYEDHVGGEYDVFWMGFRFGATGGHDWPEIPIQLHTNGPNDSGDRNRVLEHSELPNDSSTVVYVEIKLDFATGLISRWLDGVKLSDKSIESTIASAERGSLWWYVGSRIQYHGTIDIWVNDFYFMVDTTQDNDGLPSDRLGAVEVEALEVDSIDMPADWGGELAMTSPEPSDFVDFVNSSFDGENMRNEHYLETSEDATVGEFRFAQPDVGEGEVIMVQLETYGSREFGDNVELNTQVTQGEYTNGAMKHELEPERLKVNERALKPGQLFTAPDGGPWTEKKLGELSMRVWSTKLV